MRQPHACISADVIHDVSPTPNADDSTWLNPWLANCQLAMNPRRCGTCSTRNAVELPNSPPAENPCTRRADKNRDRRQDADGLVARHDRDRKRAEGHQDDRDHQRGLAAMAVGIGAEHDAADGANEECQSERAEGQQQRNRRIAVREKSLGNIDGEIAIGGDVVPFQRVADRDRNNEPGEALFAARLRAASPEPIVSFQVPSIPCIERGCLLLQRTRHFARDPRTGPP